MRPKVRMAALVAAFLLTSCTVGPNYRRPAIDVPSEHRGDPKAAEAATPGRIRLSRMNTNAITVVAKTSKNPSTHRCTTHHRQYSTMERCV